MTTTLLGGAWGRFKHHEIQSRLWGTTKRFVGVYAGRGSGKTEIAKRKLVISLLINKPWRDARYFYSAPTVPQAKRIAWDSLRSMIPKDWVAYENQSELWVETFVNGVSARIWIVGLDKPARIEGVQWDGGVIDESCDVRPGTFGRSILPALTHRNGWCWRIGVPKRAGWGASEFRQWCEEGEASDIPDRAVFTWPSSDILSPDQLRYARENLDPKDFNEQFNARWETAGGQVFYAFDRIENVRPCSYDPSKPLIVSSDFNVDPMAWVIGHAYDSHIEWFDELWLRDANTPKALDALWGRYNQHRGGFRFYGDASGGARRTSATFSDVAHIANDRRFREAGRRVFYLASNPAVSDRFAACNALFCNAAGQRRMFIAPTCKNLLRDIEARYYEPGTRQPAAPKGTDLGHITDAMGYAVCVLFPLTMKAGTTSAVSMTTAK